MKNKLIIVVVVILSFVGLIYTFGWGGAVAGLFETVAIYALANPDKASEYLGASYKQLRAVNFWFERSAVGKRVESAINLAVSKVNGEGVNLLPHGIRIKWVEPENREAFLKEDKIVVCLENSYNEERNIARTAFLYATEDLVRESQRFIDAGVLKASCFTIARKLLMTQRRFDALRCLNEELLKKEIANDPSLGGFIQTMEKLDQEGLFTRMFMRELSLIDAKLPSVLSDPAAEAESLSFLDTMKKLADKQRGVDISPSHRGKIIDMNVMLVAREGVSDPTPYIRYAERCWVDGVSTLYAMALYNNILLANSAISCIRSYSHFTVEKEWRYEIPYKGKKVPAYLAVLNRIDK